RSSRATFAHLPADVPVSPALAPISQDRARNQRQAACPPLAHLEVLLEVAGHVATSRRAHHSFPKADFSARMSRLRSATICFSLRFSSSRCRSRFASLISMPPYFAFQR